ncbi:MAG: alpha-amylase family glycosyl hydrolase, partial [Clostridia bacterium]|nr:alpha-amylase family glycosyl hydrolase [Clostridia bacterium]
MSKLMELRELLYEKAQLYKDQVFNYTVPDLRNCFDYSGEEMVKTSWGELIVNPYRFYLELIDRFIIKNETVHNDYSLPLSFTDPVEDRLKGGDWIKKAIVYSMMIRTSTSWDHDRTGSLEKENIYNLKETGTFLKSLAILSLLKKMGVTAVYLLPISKFSLKGKKGELGSPYGVSNFFKLDPELKDPITGDSFTVEDEFSAFVEACHRLGMRVMIDIIPRTNSVNSDLILEHPDWFYWIDLPTLQGYRPPYVPGLGENVLPKPEFLPLIYQSHEVRQH